MRLQVKGKNVEVSDSIRRYAEQKLRKLDRKLHALTQVELELRVERNPSISANQVAEATFVGLEDGSLLGEDGDGDLTMLAEAVEREIEAPYRAIAIRRSKKQWAVAARRLRVVELPEPGGDEIELVIKGDERTLVVDGNSSFGTIPGLEALAQGDSVIRAARLDGSLWEVRVDPL